VGIAIDEGFISGVDEKVFTFFPEYSHHIYGQKSEITIEDLLTMTSGLGWNGMEVFVGSRDPRNDLIQLFQVEDPVDYILAKPQVSEPGTRWYYHGGGTNLLGVIIHRATGMRMDRFAEQYLFTPLSIEKYEWDFISDDIVHASGNLALRPRDMAKLGYLFLKNGWWGNNQIVSKEWVIQSTQKLANTTSGEGYGYQWWVKTYHRNNRAFKTYYAAGWGGQRIIAFPEYEMVVVFTGGNYVTYEPVDEIILDNILPALK
jgi:CubicO group peptidase (beta-lactamase class C family)